MRALLELIAPSVCPACDAPRRERELLLCPDCRAGLRPRSWLGPLPTALAYERTAARLLVRFKFEHRRDGLAVLLAALERRAARLGGDVVVPVPRHPDRIRDLAADPVFELARALARSSGRGLTDGVLQRTRPTPPQTWLPRAARLANPDGSFAAHEGALRGRDVLLLDDVTTTGATLCAAARALRRAGPRRLVALALAGTPVL